MITAHQHERVVFLLEGKDIPSTRFRIEQYEGVLVQRGVPFTNCYSWPAKFSHYPRALRKSPLRYLVGAAATVLMVLTRLVQAALWIPGASVIVFQRELLHAVPSAFLEKTLVYWARRVAPRARIVFDIDDAIFLDRRTTRNAATEKKISEIAALSDTILAGNQFLADHFKPQAALVLPTVLDLAKYPKKKPHSFSSKDSPLVLGWTGSRSTSAYLELIAKPLAQFIGETNSRLIVVSEKDTPLPSQIPNTRIVSWSRESEIQTLLEFDVGLMPLPDDKWSRGKCGLKLLQYGAVGIPAIASPVGVNPLMIVQGKTGFLASTEEDWYRLLKQLHEERERLSTMGALARKHIEDNYSLEVYANRWLAALLGKSHPGTS
jgi:glycosyltransferase involved in cell wall biosynthesis